MNTRIALVALMASASTLDASECLKLRMDAVNAENLSVVRAYEELYIKYPIILTQGYLVIAIMEHESGFRNRVRSPKGAVGIMQLMKGATIDAMKHCNLPKEFRKDTIRGNMELGMCYILWLKKHYNLTHVETAIAYNGGFGAVKRFRARKALPRETYLYALNVTNSMQKCWVNDLGKES